MDSTRITSAPSAAISRQADGPDQTTVMSITRMPRSGRSTMTSSRASDDPERAGSEQLRRAHAQLAVDVRVVLAHGGRGPPGLEAAVLHAPRRAGAAVRAGHRVHQFGEVVAAREVRVAEQVAGLVDREHRP